MSEPPIETTRRPSESTALRDALVAYAAVTALTWLVASLGRGSPFDAYVPLAIGALFGLSAIELAQRRPDGLTRYGLRLGGLLEPPPHPPAGLWGSLLDLAGALRRALPIGVREAAVALAVAAVVFPPFALGFHFWHAPTHAFGLRWPEEPLGFVLGQLVVIALPEEAFFRGYLQGRLGDRFVTRIPLLGARLCPQAWLGQALAFALVHALVDLDLLRLAVFFPALLFGWLRELRGGIGAAVVLHALSNFLSDLLVRGWL